MLLYQVIVRNDGNSEATGVVFTDTPDANTAIVPGSVQTSLGSVTGGNGGTPPIVVDIGSLSGRGGSATSSFTVGVDTPLPLGVDEVANQGVVQGDQLAAQSTDDPDTVGTGDSTVLPVAAEPINIAYVNTAGDPNNANDRYADVTQTFSSACSCY